MVCLRNIFRKKHYISKIENKCQLFELYTNVWILNKLVYGDVCYTLSSDQIPYSRVNPTVSTPWILKGQNKTLHNKKGLSFSSICGSKWSYIQFKLLQKMIPNYYKVPSGSAITSQKTFTYPTRPPSKPLSKLSLHP